MPSGRPTHDNGAGGDGVPLADAVEVVDAVNDTVGVADGGKNVGVAVAVVEIDADADLDVANSGRKAQIGLDVSTMASP